MQVIFDAQDRCVGKGRFIDVEECVADSEVREDHEVDLPLQRSFIRWRDGFVEVGGVGEECQCRVAVVVFG